MKLSSIYNHIYAIVYSTGYRDEVELVTKRIFTSLEEAQECIAEYNSKDYLDLKIVEISQFNKAIISNL